MNTENKTLLSKEEENLLKVKIEFKNLMEELLKRTYVLMEESKKDKNSPSLEPVTFLVIETERAIDSFLENLSHTGLQGSRPEVNTTASLDNRNTTEEIRKKEIIDEREERLVEAIFNTYPYVPSNPIVSEKPCDLVKKKDSKFLSFLRKAKRVIKKYAKKLTVLILLPFRTVYKSFLKISHR